MDVWRESGGKQVDASRVMEKVQQLRRGIPAEDEFVAMCLWSNQCKLVHKLEPPKGSVPTGYRVPDFLCVFEHRGQAIPVLVEVKSTEKDTLKLGRTYVNEFKTYAELLGIPLLIAIRHTKIDEGLWVVAELDQLRTERGSYRAYLPKAMEYDLTSLLMGNFSLLIREGTALCMTISKNTVHTDGSFNGTLKEMFWETADGTRHSTNVAPYLHLAFMLSPDEVEIDENPTQVIQRFRKVGNGSVFAYWVMPMAWSLSGFLSSAEVPWAKLLNEEKPGFSIEDLFQSADPRSGLVEQRVRWHPKVLPDFLKP